MSETRHDYETPWPVVHWLEKRYGLQGFDLDPCCSSKTRKAPHYFTEADNGLARDWFGSVFMNPPWTKELLPRFLEHAYSQSLDGVGLICGLVPVRADSSYWHDYIFNGGASEVIFIRGRIRFLLDGVLQKSPDMKNVCAFPVWKGGKRRLAQPTLYTVDVNELR